MSNSSAIPSVRVLGLFVWHLESMAFLAILFGMAPLSSHAQTPDERCTLSIRSELMPNGPFTELRAVPELSCTYTQNVLSADDVAQLRAQSMELNLKALELEVQNQQAERQLQLEESKLVARLFKQHLKKYGNRVPAPVLMDLAQSEATGNWNHVTELLQRIDKAEKESQIACPHLKELRAGVLKGDGYLTANDGSQVRKEDLYQWLRAECKQRSNKTGSRTTKRPPERHPLEYFINQSITAPPDSSASTCEDWHWLQSVGDNGALVTLEDGSIWKVALGDNIESALWLPYEPIRACGSNLVNKDNDDTVAAKRLK